MLHVGVMVPNTTICFGGMTRLIGVAGAVGLLMSTAASLAVVVALLPRTPGRLAYYTLVAGAAAPGLALIGLVGATLSALAMLSGARPRRLYSIGLALGSAAMLASCTMIGSVWRIARHQRLQVPLRECLLPPSATAIAEPEVVTFAAGEGWALQADLYRPSASLHGSVRLPCLVVVHGGAWCKGDKGENTDWNVFLASRGYVVLDVQYRLAPTVDWRGATADILHAVAWVRARAAELGVDPERVTLLGRSAGGHLALVAAYSSAASGDRRPIPVVAFYAPTDLQRLYEGVRGGPAAEIQDGLRAVLGGAPADRPSEYHAASPVHLAQANAPATLLIHGAWDRAVPAGQSKDLARRLAHADVPVRLLLLPFARHSFDQVPYGLATQVARVAVERFLAELWPAADADSSG